MKALVLRASNTLPVFDSVESPIPSQGQIELQLKAASLNHRDVWIAKGQYPGLRYPVVLGSDAVGVWQGEEVLIQPGINWGTDERAQGKHYQILGLPLNGTFAEKIALDQNQVYPKPAHLSNIEAAALPLAGLTAYRVLFNRCQAKEGESVLVTGAGGGVALFCIQYALKAGLEVYVTSGSEDKLAKAKLMGVEGIANYKSTDWPILLKKQANGFDIIIDGTGGTNFSELVKLSKPGGRIGVYGGTLGAVPDFSPQPIFWKQLSILGSTMGSDRDFGAMLDFVSKHKIVPIVDSVFSLSEGQNAFRRMEAGQQFGKIVLEIA